MNAITASETQQLVLIDPMPLDQNAAAVYLAGLSKGSRRTMRQALDSIAAILSGGRVGAFVLGTNVPGLLYWLYKSAKIRRKRMTNKAICSARQRPGLSENRQRRRLPGKIGFELSGFRGKLEYP